MLDGVGVGFLSRNVKNNLQRKTLERTRARGDTVHGAGHKPQLEKAQQQMILEKSRETRWSEES